MKKTVMIWLIGMLLLAGCETKTPDYALPKIETLDATYITGTSATLNGKITKGVNEESWTYVGFDFSTDPNFSDYVRLWVEEDAERTIDISYFTRFVNGIKSETTYYYRMVLDKQHHLSTPIFANTMSFTTKTEQVSATVNIETGYVRSVSSTTARVTGTCTATGTTITEWGMLLGENGSKPTISSYYSNIVCSNPNMLNSTRWSFLWWGLPPSTTYTYRAYAKDNEGKVYYGNVRKFTTKTEPGGALTATDFVGTYTITAYSPWESRSVSWNDVQIIQYNGDTLVATGWDGRDELRAVGIFDKGMQVVRFESDWYFEAYTFTAGSTSNCVAMFMPAYYNSTDQMAYTLTTGGKHENTRGEIWLSLTGINKYAFTACDGDSDDGFYANGFIFNYYNLSNWHKVGSSQVYINVTFNRTSTTTTRSLPRRINQTTERPINRANENENESNCSTMSAAMPN